MVEALVQDLRYGLRLVRAHKAFSCVVVAILGLGIGANTAIFSLVDGALLHPLPFADSDGLRLIDAAATATGARARGLSWPELREYADGASSFERLAAVAATAVTLERGPLAERIDAEIVSGGYFEVLRVEPLLGRTFAAEENRPSGTGQVALLGHGLWRRAFAGDPGVVGSSVRIAGRELTVIGILPAGFAGVTLRAEAWLPVPLASWEQASAGGPVAGELDRGRERWLLGVGRLAAGASDERARQELAAITAGRAGDGATTVPPGARLRSLRDVYLGQVELALMALLASVGGVLLIACANVTNLLLARSASRSSEVAVRLALGARRARLFRQLLTESLVLALAGGGAGTLIALWSVEALAAALPAGLIPAYVSLEVDTSVFLFTSAVTIGAGVLSGLAPALRCSRADAGPVATRSSRAVVGAAGRRMGVQAAVVTVQVTLTVALLICAGVTTRSLWMQLAEEPGFEARGVLALRLALPSDASDPSRHAAFVRELSVELDGLAGTASSIALASDLPFRGGLQPGHLWREEGPLEPEAARRFYAHAVSPGFFAVLGVPLREGRDFDAMDAGSGPRVAIVSAATARLVWPGEGSALGRRLLLAPDDEPWTVVGVAGDMKYRNLTDDLLGAGAAPDVYVPIARWPTPVMEVVARSEGDPGSVANGVREAVRRVDPSVPVDDVADLSSVLARQTAMGRLQSSMLLAFGLLGLALGAAGIYGLLAYAVARRQREIGIRLALGAAPADVVRSFLRRGLWLTAPGLALGLVLGVQAAFGMRGLLYGVSAADPATLAATVVVVGVAATGASWLPARRAAAVDPAATLRAE